MLRRVLVKLIFRSCSSSLSWLGLSRKALLITYDGFALKLSPGLITLIQIIAFVVPSVPLVHQQSQYIMRETNAKVKAYSGDMKGQLACLLTYDGTKFFSSVDLWDINRWSDELRDADVIVLTAQVSHK